MTLGIYLLNIIFFLCFNIIADAASIDVYVNNVNGLKVSGAKVLLYPVNKTAYTDDNGYVRFHSLDYGNYTYEIYYNGTGDDEFWGGEDISLQEPLIIRDFTRNWPYKYSETLPSNSYVGQEAQFKIKVKNNLSFSRKVKVELWVDRNKSGDWDFNPTSNEETIFGIGLTKTFTFDYTPTSSGTYYWKMHVYSWNDGANDYILTDSTGWDVAFTASYQTGSVTVFVENVNGAKAQGCDVVLASETKTTDSNGEAYFPSIRYGEDYNYEVYCNNTGIEEFWGNKLITVDSSFESDTFRRNWPYKYNESIPGNAYYGQSAHFEITVKNALSFSRDVKVELRIDRDQNESWDFDELSPKKSMSDGDISVFDFSFTPDNPGTYYWKAIIYAWNDGSEDYIVTDTSAWNEAFTMPREPLPQLKGRIAFHRDANNKESPHEPLTPDDGHIFVYDLKGGNLPKKVTANFDIGQSMNPSFSPDGSKLVFMAIPSGQSLSYDNMRVYVLDLAVPQGKPKDLGVGQDPKFSPDGSHIIFKKYGWGDNDQYEPQLWIVGSYSENSDDSEQLTFSPGEKSGPNYSLDGNFIVYWLNAKEKADVWLMNKSGAEQVEIIGTPFGTDPVQDYYPIYRDDDNILFTKSDPSDKIYNFKISTSTQKKLDGLNSPPNACKDENGKDVDCEDADAFPVIDLVGFSSTRKSNWPDYDLYISGEDGTPFGEITEANSKIGELGGNYTPYSYAREIELIAPVQNGSLDSESNYILKVRAYSDGAIWNNASPTVTFSGPETKTYSGLNDNGSDGDQEAGDGIYSKTIVTPATSGTYNVKVTSVSQDNGLQNALFSNGLDIDIVRVETTRIIELSRDLAFGNVTVGQTSQLTLTIQNKGNSILTVSGITYPAGFNGNWSSGDIYVGESQDIVVTFTPEEANSYGGIITVSSNKTSGTNTSICTGTGIIISDSDNDGLLDTWEIQYFGDLNTADSTTNNDSDDLLDKDEFTYGTDPKKQDTDGDGDSDNDEVYYGTDPTLIADNLNSHRPVKPVVADILTEVIPFQEVSFDVNEFVDPDENSGDYLSISEWQISLNNSFDVDQIVYWKEFVGEEGGPLDEKSLCSLYLPAGILMKNKVYWIRSRHYDSVGLASEWSEPKSFETVAADPNDVDEDGIKDTCQIDGYVDTNGNSVNDRTEGIQPMLDSEKGYQVGIHASNGSLSNLSTCPNSDILTDILPDDPMPYGLFNFRVDGLPVDQKFPASVDITFYFEDTLPANTKWYKYDAIDETMIEMISSISVNGNVVILTVTDGGTDDMDGVINGVIIDPSGPAFTVDSVSTPIVTGTTPTNDTTPTWTQTTGGGGNGTYRYKLDNSDLSSGATETTNASYTPSSAISEGSHTLYVQELDNANNWSNSGSKEIVIDITAPSNPAVTGTSPTNDATPTWIWTSGGGGNGTYRYKLDNSDLSSGATETTSTNFTSSNALSEGRHTLYVQEQDNAGNWSNTGSKEIVIESVQDDPNDKPTADDGGGGGGGGIFGIISAADVIGYHFDWNNKDGIAVYMPVTKYFKALKGMQTNIEGFAPGLADFIRGRFDALEREAKENPDGSLSKIGTKLFPALGKIAEIYLDMVGEEELMEDAYIKTTISVNDFNKLHREGKAISSHSVKVDSEQWNLGELFAGIYNYSNEKWG